MKVLAALCAGAFAAGSLLVTPVLAATDTTTTTTNSTSDTIQHEIDCFGLLFSDPAAHAAQCGGPFNPGSPPHASGGSGPGCTIGEVAPMQIPGLPVVASDADVLVAGNPCCAEFLTTPWQMPDGTVGFGIKPRVLVATICQ